MSLPQKLPIDLMQTRWASIIDPFLANPFLQGNLLRDVVLVSGETILNHLLGRKMQGWVIVDINGSASIYRSQPLNGLTLSLTSDATVTVSLYVF